MKKPTTIPEAIGSFLIAFRNEHNLTLDEVARAGRTHGMNWSASSVRNIEAGNSSTPLPALISLALTLNDLTDGELRLEDLLGDSTALSQPTVDGYPVTRGWLNRVLSGAAVTLDYSDLVGGDRLKRKDEIELTKHGADLVLDTRNFPRVKMKQIREASRPVSLAEERAASKLGIEPLALKLWAYKLYEARTLEQEAEKRAIERSELTGKPVTAQTRGAMTRQLIKEINAAMKANPDGPTS